MFPRLLRKNVKLKEVSTRRLRLFSLCIASTCFRSPTCSSASFVAPCLAPSANPFTDFQHISAKLLPRHRGVSHILSCSTGLKARSQFMSLHSPMQAVRESTQRACLASKHVWLDQTSLKRLAAEYSQSFKSKGDDDTGWGEEIHFVGKEELTVQYLLALDAINFCFWPSEGQWEYADVSGALKQAVQSDEEVLSAVRLSKITEQELRALLGGKDMPNMQDRARLLREVGTGLLTDYGGSAARMVRSCDRSAANLVRAMITAFPGFQDVAQYNGKEVAFYKRAQIFVGDVRFNAQVWGALKGQGLGEFDDIAEITMFADYRVPQILEARGVMQYSPALKDAIMAKKEIPAGAEEEVELRAWTVQAVEELRRELATVHGIQRMSIQVDWFLWEEGERKAIAGQLPPHHRTRTTFY